MALDNRLATWLIPPYSGGVDRKWLQSLPVSFDAAKSEANRSDPSRGFGFEIAERFGFEGAIVEIDDRNDYGEVRLAALGEIDDRLHVLIFTIRRDGLRVISLRKANGREIRRYRRIVNEGGS